MENGRYQRKISPCGRAAVMNCIKNLTLSVLSLKYLKKYQKVSKNSVTKRLFAPLYT